MGTPLSDKIGEVIDLAIHSYDGYVVWRGDILGEKWKIIVSYDAADEKINIYTKRRDYFPPRE